MHPSPVCPLSRLRLSIQTPSSEFQLNRTLLGRSRRGKPRSLIVSAFCSTQFETIHRLLAFYSFPATPARSQDNLTSIAGSSDTDYEEESNPDDEWGGNRPLLPRSSTAPTSSRLQSLLRRARRRIARFFKGLNEFMTIPMYAAVASLIVACVPVMQHALDQHMQPVKGALLNAGSCSIPVTLIVLGAYFYRPPEPVADSANGATQVSYAGDRRVSSSSMASLVGSWRDGIQLSSLMKKSKTPSQYPGETKTVFIAVLSRMVITPLVLLPLMAIFTTYDPHELFAE